MTIGLSPRPMRRLTVMLNSRDRAYHHPLATEVLSGVGRAHLLHAVETRGCSGTLHRQHHFAEGAPAAILIVDRAHKLEAFLESIRSSVEDSLVVLDHLVAFRS
jgi:PII-like signaling protein